MSECLLIRIHPVDSSLSWVWLDKNQPTYNDLAEAADKALSICVLTPSEHLFLTATALPPLAPNRLLKAIPYALEDQLSSETENLHFAFIREDKLSPVNIGVVSREQMYLWLELLKTALPHAYQKIQSFIPDCLCLPYVEQEASVLVDGDLTLVRTGTQLGFAVETSSVAHLLTQWVLSHQPNKLSVYYTQDALDLSHLSVPVQQQPIAAVLPFLAEHTQVESSLNLLQNEFSPKHKQIRLEQIVKFAVLLFSTWLAILTFWNIADIILLKREQFALNDQTEALYGLVHPKMTIPEEPKLSLQKELASLRANHKDSNFIRLISHLADNVPTLIQAGVELQNLNFRSNQIVLLLTTPDLKPIETLQQRLEQKGLKATLSNAERSGSNKIQVRLTVEELS